ncbi:MAG: WD40 repeat domain-containing protein, partial [Planctomycetia bacterium]|nr:WD40 repeat domain-containing protein [Planctomycetia bacterium]
AAFNPNKEELAVAFKDRAEVWTIRGDAKKSVVRKLPTDGPVTALAYSKDGKLLAVGIRKLVRVDPVDVRAIGSKSEVYVFNVAVGKELIRFDGFASVNEATLAVTALAFHPDGKKLAAGTGFVSTEPISRVAIPKTGEVKIWILDAPTPPPPLEKFALEPTARHWRDAAVLTDHGRLVNGVAVAPDGKSFAAATDGNITVWDSATRKVLWKHKHTDSAVFALAYSPDGKHICIATTIDVTRLDARTGKNDPWTDDNAIWFGKVRALAYRPGGEWLAASDGYWTGMRTLNAKGEEATIVERPKIKVFPEKPAGVAWSKDGKRLAFIHYQNVDGKWPVGIETEGKPAMVLAGHTEQVTCLAWSKDGKVIASGDEKGTVILWDAETGKELWRKEFKGGDPNKLPFGQPIDEKPARINSLAISPFDNTVAAAVSFGAGNKRERVVLLAAKDGKEEDQLMRAWMIPVSSVAWPNDGKFLVTGCGIPPGVTIKMSDQPTSEVVVWERK